MKSLPAFAALPLLVILLAFTTSVKIGTTIADFTLKNVDGKTVSTASYARNKGLIIVFTCNHCPFAKKYQQRFNALNAKYTAQGFPLIAISSNDFVSFPEDSYDNMKTRAKEEHYNFPYLYDETQSVAKTFGAARTPQAFVLQREDKNWVIRYSGAIDDNGAEPEKVTHAYLEDAVKALLQNKPVQMPETKSIGCSIKFKN